MPSNRITRPGVEGSTGCGRADNTAASATPAASAAATPTEATASATGAAKANGVSAVWLTVGAVVLVGAVGAMLLARPRAASAADK
jgi:hypothetical protein